MAVPMVVPPPAATQHQRRLHLSVLPPLRADVDLIELQSWQRRWDDFARLGGLEELSIGDQAATLRLALDPTMQRIVEVALGILPDAYKKQPKF